MASRLRTLVRMLVLALVMLCCVLFMHVQRPALLLRCIFIFRKEKFREDETIGIRRVPVPVEKISHELELYKLVSN